jgi:hypothetical protein
VQSQQALPFTSAAVLWHDDNSRRRSEERFKAPPFHSPILSAKIPIATA